MYDELDTRGIRVIAIAQEDTDLSKHGKILSKFKPEPRFEVVADIDRAKTTRYDRTTTYYIDSAGVVQQVFPQLIHHRASWISLLHEIDRLGQ